LNLGGFFTIRGDLGFRVTSFAIPNVLLERVPLSLLTKLRFDGLIPTGAVYGFSKV
jgi:hypothetical protein